MQLSHIRKGYRQISNICRTLIGNNIVDRSGVFGASPWSAWHLASRDCTKINARWDEKHLTFGICAAYISDLTVFKIYCCDLLCLNTCNSRRKHARLLCRLLISDTLMCCWFTRLSQEEPTKSAKSAQSCWQLSQYRWFAARCQICLCDATVRLMTRRVCLRN